jgi:hypothetical protein
MIVSRLARFGTQNRWIVETSMVNYKLAERNSNLLEVEFLKDRLLDRRSWAVSANIQTPLVRWIDHNGFCIFFDIHRQRSAVHLRLLPLSIQLWPSFLLLLFPLSSILLHQVHDGYIANNEIKNEMNHHNHHHWPVHHYNYHLT